MNLDKRLDEILEEYFFPEDVARNNSNDKYLIYGAKAIKQLMADEFEKVKIEQTKLIRDRFVRDGWEYKWLTEMIEELRQKLEEWKK